MNVQQCMSTDVRVCAPDASIREAARTMREIDAGFLPVGENDRLVGVISLGDVSRSADAGESGDALRHISEPTGLHSQH